MNNYETLQNERATLAAKMGDGGQRLQAIERELLTADASGRAQLLNEMVSLWNELQNIPVQLGQIVRLECLAHLGQLRQQWLDAHQELGKAEEALEPYEASMSGLRHEDQRLQGLGRQFGGPSPDLRIAETVAEVTKMERSALRAQRQEIVQDLRKTAAEAQPHQKRVNQIRMEIKAAAGKAKNYGADIAQPGGWQRIAYEHGRKMAQAARAELAELVPGMFSTLAVR